jgi:hypothetical protein
MTTALQSLTRKLASATALSVSITAGSVDPPAVKCKLDAAL